MYYSTYLLTGMADFAMKSMLVSRELLALPTYLPTLLNLQFDIIIHN